MNNQTTVTAFLGDAERKFWLSPELIVELERKCGSGIGEVSRRLFSGLFQFHDVVEVIRLALIGGGEKPERASEIVALYVLPYPLNDSYALAVTIVESAWFGAQKPEGSDSDDDE